VRDATKAGRQLRRAASRSALVAAAVLVALGIAAAAFWFWRLPGYPPWPKERAMASTCPPTRAASTGRA
jgi:hypothetical protein